jgi:rod shape-determining protein MreD
MSAAGRLARFVVLIVIALTLQVSVASQITVFGYVTDLLLLVAVSAGVNGGSDHGAMIGFGCGLASDLIVQTPFGMWILTMSVIGYAAGAATTRVVDGGRGIRSVVVGLITASGIGLFVALAWLLDLTYVTEQPIAAIVAVVGLSSMALNPLVERAVRWGLLIRPNFAGTPA